MYLITWISHFNSLQGLTKLQPTFILETSRVTGMRIMWLVLEFRHTALALGSYCHEDILLWYFLVYIDSMLCVLAI